MTPARFRWWLLAKLKREAWEIWLDLVNRVRWLSWPFRDPGTWWEYRRITWAVGRAIPCGDSVLVA